MDKKLHSKICNLLIDTDSKKYVNSLIIQFYVERWKPLQIVSILEKMGYKSNQNSVNTVLQRHKTIINKLKAQ